ncbi:MAG: glycosyltransferase family 87 protein [Thermodesulfobacteriota bacterium]|nr:glycosyltransferase family 87 protein [Thermodesulfobacteriota bacterium]
MFNLKPRTKKLLIAAFLIIYLVPGIKVINKAKENRTAFLRWTQHSERIKHGETIYGEKGGYYPNLPCMLMILMPFHAMGPIAGSIAWLTFKFLIILFIFSAIIKMVQNNGPPLPEWAVLLLIVLSMRVFFSDLTHGNVNLIIGGLIVLSMLCSFHKKLFLSGILIGLATVLKVTPALFIPYFLYKRRWTSVAGAFAGIFLFCWLVPGLILGFDFNNQLIIEWYNQMILPFLSDMPVNYMQTQHMNQSFTGLFFRLFSDSVAITADARGTYNELKINFISLDQQTVSLIVKAASLAMVGFLAWFCRTPHNDHKHLGNIGEFAMVFLSMLLLSERSWKHHYILLILSHSFLLYYLLIIKPSGWSKWIPLSFMILAIFLHNFTSSFFFGNYGSDVLEAYGVHVIGGLLLFVSCAVALKTLRLQGWPNQ